MKILLILLALTGVSMSSIAEQINSINYYQELVQNIEADARKSRIKGDVAFIDAYSFLGRKEPYISFQKEMAISSGFILAHIDEITSNEYQKAIIVMSTWEMTRETFVRFLNSMADAVEAGKLDRRFFKWAQSPTESHLSGLLIREYGKPDIQSIIIRSRKIFQDQPALVAQYDSMLSGESCNKLKKFKAAMRDAQPSITNHNQSQEPITKKSIIQNTTTQINPVTAPKIKTFSTRQATEDPGQDNVESTRAEEKIRESVLPIVIGIITVFACVGIWVFRKNG